jgi:hypothetical protein
MVPAPCVVITSRASVKQKLDNIAEKREQSLKGASNEISKGAFPFSTFCPFS